MHYLPGTPWYDPTLAELELEMAAGRIKPAAQYDANPKRFRPIWALAGVLSLQFALVGLIIWVG